MDKKKGSLFSRVLGKFISVKVKYDLIPEDIVLSLEQQRDELAKRKTIVEAYE